MEEEYFSKPLPGKPGDGSPAAAPSSARGPSHNRPVSSKPPAASSPPSFPAFPESLSTSPTSSSKFSPPTPAPPGKERIMPQGVMHGSFPTAFPAILHYRITEKEWKDIVKKVNDLWQPVVEEEGRRVVAQQNVITMTILGVPLNYAKDLKFRSLRKDARKSIVNYLSQVNGMLTEKRICFSFPKVTHEDIECYCIEIEVKG